MTLTINKNDFLYRFRKSQYLFDKIDYHSGKKIIKGELESKQIYIPKISELNDPMEELLNIYFCGDRVIWKNFFVHFIERFLSFIDKNDKLIVLDIIQLKNFKTFISAIENKEIKEKKMLTILQTVGSVVSQYIDNLKNNRKLLYNETLENLISYVNEESYLLPFEFALFTKKFLSDLRDILLPKMYVLSFSKDYANPVLWSHYADSHYGICLQFENKKRLNPNLGIVNLEYVTTKNIDFDFFKNIFQMETDNPFHVEKSTYVKKWQSEDYYENSGWYLFSKLKSWEYEKELRVVANEQKFKTGNFLDLTLNQDFLTGIIFGIKTPQRIKDNIKSLARQNKIFENVRFFQAFYDKKNGLIDYEPIKLTIKRRIV